MPLGIVETLFINPLIYYIMLHTIIVIAAIVAAVAGISLLSGINNSLKNLREGLKALDLSVRDRHEVYKNRDEQNRRLMGDMVNILGRIETEEKTFRPAVLAAMAESNEKLDNLKLTLATMDTRISRLESSNGSIVVYTRNVSDDLATLSNRILEMTEPKPEETVQKEQLQDPVKTEPAEEPEPQPEESPAIEFENPVQAAVESIVSKDMPAVERYAAMKKRLDEGATIQEVAKEFGYSCVRNARRFMRNHEKNAKK